MQEQVVPVCHKMSQWKKISMNDQEILLTSGEKESTSSEKRDGQPVESMKKLRKLERTL